MNIEKAKQAVELAELELQREEEQKQIDLIKKAIKQTLESIKAKEKDRDKLNKEIKTLKQDIDNIRAGRLDLIAERQEKDEEAKRTSVIEVIKEIHHHHYDRWYEPYRIIWKYDYPYTTIGSGWYTTVGGTDNYSNDLTCAATFTNSIAKDASVGTYQLDSGDCITLT
uniref:Uncharacterized protein n=1 Tax=viral metagenome TaxID=1070528 RepID=A0A6M3LX07_9ZZZZ